MKTPMPFAKKLAALAATAAFALPAIAVHASQGDVLDVSFRDLDHNGRIERAIVTISNPDRKSYAVTDASGLRVTYGDKVLVPTSAYLITTGEPAKLAIIWDQNDPNLPVDTGVGSFAIEWPAFNISKTSNKTDLAAPMLVGSDPVAGSLHVGRTRPVTLTFSEPIDSTKFSWTADRDASGWTPSWSADGRVATLAHTRYAASDRVSFTVTEATDLAGNAVLRGGIYPNPFSFANGTTDNSAASIDPVFLLNEPAALATLLVDRPNVISWYTNQPEVAQVRIKWSVDGGSSYRTIGTYPATKASVLWYAPSEPGNFTLKIEGLNASDALVAVDTRSPISLSESMTLPEPGTEQYAPSLPAAQPGVPSPNDKTAPKLVGNVIVDQLNPADGTGRVSWVTDEPSNGSVIYGILKDYSHTGSVASFSTTHTLSLCGLTPGVIHNLRLTVVDASNNAAATDDIIFSFYKDGDLVKGSGAAVYWVHAGKRDVFPNAQIYATWFKDFSSVIRIGDEQLAAIQLGTNVKVKGGSKLVKIQSDPKTYSVDDNGVLHWVPTEAKARELYGASWNKNVLDLDVSLFTGYTIGDSL